MSKLRNRKLIGWKIWYSCGATVTSKEARWTECGQRSVQLVKLFYLSDNGIEVNIHSGKECYLLDDLLELPREIKTGKGIFYEKFLDIVNNAVADESVITSMI